MFDPTKPVQRRDGAKARIICTDRDYNIYTIVALIGDSQEPEEFTAKGNYSYRDEMHDFKNDYDLINIPEKHVRYINIYDYDGTIFYSHKSKEEADNKQERGRLACIRVDFKEGQFDE